VIPGTLLGLAAFAASVGPGYLYVRRAELREPRLERTPLREAAELLVIGATLSAFAVLLTIAIGDHWGFIDPARLLNDPVAYVLAEPFNLVAGLALTLAMSYGAAFSLAELMYMGKPRDVAPEDTPWIAAFRRDLPKGYGAYVTVGLKDGRTITGALRAVPTHGSVASEDVYLTAPEGGQLWVVHPTNGTFPIEDTFVLVRGNEVLFVSGRYGTASS
jgi:small nuclear ribonucleoprotein (snRNP)-like protein